MFKIIIAWILIAFILLLTIHYLISTINLLFFPKKKAPFVPSFDRHLKIMENLEIKKGSTMIDLWCWDGKALRFFAKNFWIKSADWFDINTYAIIRWKIINKCKKINNINLYKKNFFKADLKKYDYIYLYLWDTQLKIMEDWIRENKKTECIIISNTFKFKKHEPFKTFKNENKHDTIFLYK